jgi:hypothetical protein
MAINVGRAMGGGLLAGAVINVGEALLNMGVLGKESEKAIQAMNLPPIGGGQIASFVVAGFIVGMVLVWLYAAIRSRFGPGPGTAIKAGTVVWFLACAYPAFGMGVMQMFPVNTLFIGVTWELAEFVLAAVLGARFYSE